MPARATAAAREFLLGRSLLHITDLSAAELGEVLSLARVLKAGGMGEGRLLEGRTLALLFEKPSLRTRVSFEVAMKQLGGETLFAQGRRVMIGSRETPEDAARVLSRYVDAIVVRTHEHEPLERFARCRDRAGDQRVLGGGASVPGAGRHAYVQERFGEIRGLAHRVRGRRKQQRRGVACAKRR